MKRLGMMLLLAAAAAVPTAAKAIDVQAFVKKDMFTDIKLSPNGEYYAATVTGEDRTVLVILRRSDNKHTAIFSAGKNTHVDSFAWVNNDRVLISLAEKFGALDTPQGTGEIYAVSVDGDPEILVGGRVQGDGLGTMIKTKKVELVSADLVDDLPADEKNVVIGVWPWGNDPFTRAERMDVYSGRRIRLASAPVRNASFATDNDGVVRFAFGLGVDNVRKLYYRTGDGAEWELISDESVAGGIEWPLGFSADNQTAYLEVEQPKGPDAIVAFDIATRARKEVMRDKVADPARIIYRNGTSIPLGAFFIEGKPRAEFFDGTVPEAKLQRGLEAAFGADAVRITSQTSDGKLALVQVWSDRNPGDFYIFDTVAKKAEFLLSRRNWLAPDKLASSRAFELRARDGLALHGLVTVPNGSDGKNLPMVVLPHGGPFGIQDLWGFDHEAQILAGAGYAVLQVNYRGSGGYGRAFTQAGAKQWGKAMQDDLTDATRWAIDQGMADPKRICIYGASYGGYAALMGVAKEPDLYKCAAGYVGVYDLPMMQKEDTRDSRRLGNWSKDWVGEAADLASVSPNRFADRIKVPVFLAAGGEDKIAPIEHSKKMEAALKKAGVSVETLYYDTEGHGFYVEEHEREFYTRLLAFLGKHLGGAVATTAAPAASTAK